MAGSARENASGNTRPERAELQLLAGVDGQGAPIMERVEAYVMEEKGCYEALRSPLFIRNLAAGDIFRVAAGGQGDQAGEFSIVQRSGKLAIRLFCKSAIDALEQQLTPEVEKLDGSLDLKTERALVYSLHVNIGFSAIEQLFDGMMSRYPETAWYYGNIYDPRDGVTPLNWWDEFINQV